MHHTILYLTSLEPATLLATQQELVVMVVVQSTHQTTLYLASVGSTTSSTTQHSLI